MIQKRSPLQPIAAGLNARFINVDGWQLPNIYGSIDEEIKIAQRRVGMVDQSASTRIIVEGAEAGTLLNRCFKIGSLSMNQGVAKSKGPAVFMLRPDRFLVHDLPSATSEHLRALEDGRDPSDGLITVTDIAHGTAELMLVGPDSDDLMSTVCGLDFIDTEFPNMTAKQSSVAKTAQTIVRQDIQGLRSYTLIGPRSYGIYLWETLMEAGAHFNAGPIGQAALGRLGSS